MFEAGRLFSLLILASASKDYTIRIWDAISQHTDMALTGHKGAVLCIRWGGTGYIYSASHDRTVKVWDTSKGTLVHTLNSHAHRVNHLARSSLFHADRQRRRRR